MATLHRIRLSLSLALTNLRIALLAGYSRLDKSLSPSLTLHRLIAHKFVWSDITYPIHLSIALFWLSIMRSPSFPSKLLIPLLYTIALLLPLTNQFFLPATPVFSWLLAFFSNKFIPHSYRPTVLVSLLPTLESVLYGANISDILTRYTHPLLDILAWLPYGVVHFTFPFLIALFLFLFRTKHALHLWARTFGYMNLIGVFIQIIVPTSPPWYEVIHGLTPASYSMLGSPGGLARIDKLFGSNGYTVGFTHSPLPFGAFPSLHSGNATLAALFVTHFFPGYTKAVWCYCVVLYWATMYLTHHYLIDVVGGVCIASVFFYMFLPNELRGDAALEYPPNYTPAGFARGRTARSKYEQYDLEDPRARLNAYSFGSSPSARGNAREFDASSEPSSEDEELDITGTYRSPVPGQGQTPKKSKTQKHPKTHTHTHTHTHTASIASLIRGDERRALDGDEGWRGV
ncbi:hypothetical protein CPB83DRAFT_762517 [Crepidotus variabilis]|uniref:Phosphatidic acid phosphatase type 2/haloperoxidase domain-containing protein n=1 Tax=Crepidotus variabilis TaxID=179855 RepID=A0A9P6EKG2_9AGAR|nr:hypothetical protein CPB83DRAFT_762517 [Crepidotus variabilis]